MNNKQKEKPELANANTNKNSAKETENQVNNHNKAAAHHIEAAKHHLKAAENFENGARGKSAKHAMLAYGHSAIAGEFHNDNAKHHAQTLKETKYQ